MDLTIVAKRSVKLGKEIIQMQYCLAETKSGYGVYIDEVANDGKGSSIDSEYALNLTSKKSIAIDLCKKLYKQEVTSIHLISVLNDMGY